MLVCSCGGGSFGTAWLVMLTGNDASDWIPMPPCRCGGGGFANAEPVLLNSWLCLPLSCRCGDGRGGVKAVWFSMPLCWCAGASFGTAWLVLFTAHDTTAWRSMPPCGCGGGGGGGFAIAGPVSLTPHVTVE